MQISLYKIHVYTENTLYELLCKLQDLVAPENKNNIVYDIGCSICKAFYYGESKQSFNHISQGLI